MGVLATDLPPGANPDWTIPQGFERYTEADHQTWVTLYERQAELLPGRACAAFVRGLDALDLRGRGIPDFAQLNEKLSALTGWTVVAVPGLVPDGIFFDHLANRRFPAGNFIRSADQLDYLEEPDIFHDVFGHVPMLTDHVFADYMQAYGKGGQRALFLGNLQNLARLYWYTVEFGLLETHDGLRIYGAGIVSSRTESIFALSSPSPNRLGFDLERVMRTLYRIDDFQQVYFVIPSLNYLLRWVSTRPPRSCTTHRRMASRCVRFASTPCAGTAPWSRPMMEGASLSASVCAWSRGLPTSMPLRSSPTADQPFVTVDDLWRRAAVPSASLVQLAEADAFGPGLGLARREALWAIKALRDEPLPLFAAAAAREAEPLPEVDEPAVVLRPMTAGSEVVEDYGHVGLTLRSHPIAFLRADLHKRRIVTCTDAMQARDGRWLEAAGLVLVRQRPGSARGVMFVTLEDETGIANLVVWPQVFEKFRRTVMAASMMAVRGRIQREGEVVHLVAHQLTDLSAELASVGDRDATFPLPHGRGDQVSHGGAGPDPRELPPKGMRTRDIYIPDLHIDTIKVKSRNFH